MEMMGLAGERLVPVVSARARLSSTFQSKISLVAKMPAAMLGTQAKLSKATIIINTVIITTD